MTEAAKGVSRRLLLAAPSLVACTAGTAACAEPARAPGQVNPATLVAYFTRSGNTRVIAATLQRAQQGGLFEIRARDPYPEDYEATVEQARGERDRGYEPSLEARVPDLGTYRTVFLGFPIWGGTMPPVVRSFLSAHDLSGATVRPFITHGGYGPGDSLEVLAARLRGAQAEPALVMQADQERRTLDEVRGWLARIA